MLPDLVGRGICIQQVYIVISYDLPYDSDQFLYCVGRTGRFGTKGIVSFSFLMSLIKKC